MQQTSSPSSLPPHPSPSAPTFRPPSGSCDSHCHIFGPQDRFPFAPERTFTPPDVPLTMLQDRHRHLLIDRAVIVQSACHGGDHSALLDALRSGGGRYRGVALPGPQMTVDAAKELHEAGVRGLRLQFLPHLGPAPSDTDVQRLADFAAELSWHLSVHVAGSGLIDRFELLESLRVPLVIDHMARVDLRDDSSSEAIRAICALIDKGNVWVKLSGLDRISLTGAPYDDAVAVAARLAQHAPERVVWGSDFPHPNIKGAAPDDGELLNLIPRIAPDERTRERLLVDNPVALFEFA